MSIEIIDGFKIIPNEDGNLLGVESNRIEVCMRYAVKKKITKIFIHAGDNYKLKDINFLEKYNFITHLTVSQNPLGVEIDISAVNQLRKLKFLSLSNKNQAIDFSCFPELEDGSIDWNNKLINIATCKKLRRLVLWKYKPKSKSFLELDGLTALQSLEITESNIESFSGIESLVKLNSFEGTYLSKLESLAGIELLSKNIRTLVLNTCKSLKDYGTALGTLTNLEKLILSKCGELNDLDFITTMRKLIFFSFVNTNIKNGNLSPLKEKKLDYAGFDDKRHYSHKMKDINPVSH